MRSFLLIVLTGLWSIAVAQVDTLPELNRRIVAFVREHIGEKVGRGECWDLAAGALNAAGADWDGEYGFGRKVDPGREAILPGDIVQFEGVEFKWEEGKGKYKVRAPHHTAVVLETKSPDAYVIGEQNTEYSGRKTGIREMILSRKTKGRIMFYRPLE